MTRRLTRLEKANLIISRVKYTVDKNTSCYIPLISEPKRNKYIKCQLENKQTSLHRIVAFVYHGLDLQSSLLALHKLECPYKCCFNENHIYISDAKQNMRDALSLRKGQLSKTHCPYGHLFDKTIYRSNGLRQRGCRTCLRAAKQRLMDKNKALKNGNKQLD